VNSVYDSYHFSRWSIPVLIHPFYFRNPTTIFHHVHPMQSSKGLWCSTPLSIIFQLYHGGQFYWWRKPELNHRATGSHWQTLSHNFVSSTPHLSGIRTHNVSGNRHPQSSKRQLHVHVTKLDYQIYSSSDLFTVK